MFRSIVRFLPSRFREKKKKKLWSLWNWTPFAWQRVRFLFFVHERKSHGNERNLFFFPRDKKTGRDNLNIYSPIRWIKSKEPCLSFFFFQGLLFFSSIRSFLREDSSNWNDYFFKNQEEGENARFLFSVKFLSIQIIIQIGFDLKTFRLKKWTRISQVRGIDWFEWKVHRGKMENFFSQRLLPHLSLLSDACIRGYNRGNARWIAFREKGASRTNSCQFLLRKIPPRFRSRLIASRSGARDAKGYCQRNREREDEHV